MLSADALEYPVFLRTQLAKLQPRCIYVVQPNLPIVQYDEKLPDVST